MSEPLRFLACLPVLAFGPAVFATGCPETVLECNPGDHEVGDRCVPIDGGGGTDANEDAPGDDAGPCGMCTGDTPLCRESDTTCVACLGDGDCGAGTPRCDVAAGECVACLGDTDCTDPSASRCETATHTCMPCTASTECAHLTGVGVCDAGDCVECTRTDGTACGGMLCDSLMRTCTTFAPGSAGLCQPCVADAHCPAGQLCVAMTFGDPPVPVGSYCLWRQDATETGGPMGDCFTIPPYVRASTGTPSIDGTSASVCSLAVTTCEALNDYRSTTCPSLDAAGHAVCGVVDVDDGVCTMAGAMTNLCTIRCAGAVDCPFGFSCLGGTCSVL